MLRSYKKLILLHQVHSNKFYYLKETGPINKKIVADALITKRKKIIIGVLTADCVPVLIFDEKKKKIVSAIHAGWKGAYKGIVKKVLQFLFKEGSESKNLTAAIGPCISQKSYEIKKDFKSKFLKQGKKNVIFFKKIKNKTYFSLNKYVYYQLKSLGVKKKIDIIDRDTYNPNNNF